MAEEITLFKMSNKYKSLAIIYSFILYTALRSTVLVLIPFGYKILRNIFHLKLEAKKLGIFTLFFVISATIGLTMNWIDLTNVIMSLWVFVPITILFFAKPIKENPKIETNKFIHITAIFLIAVDVLGIILDTGNSLTRIYGEHYEVVHGMSMVNAIYLFYYGNKFYRQEASLLEKLMAIFFLYFFFLCDFGVGKMCLVTTVGIYLLLHANWKYYIMIIIAAISWGYLSQTELFTTEMEQIRYAQDQEDNARKVLMFSQVPSFFTENPVALFVGCGPGGYNSRATQLTNQDANNIFTKLFGKHVPYWYKKYIYPLWNSTFVSMASYTDGTRNKPFSSFVAIFCEYGMFVMLLIFGTWAKRIKFYLKNEKKSLSYATLLWINLFYFISCITHEWFVSSEFVAFLIFNYLLINDLLRHKLKAI